MQYCPPGQPASLAQIPVVATQLLADAQPGEPA